jgi:tetratricopeptide (TPR) repeat protein
MGDKKAKGVVIGKSSGMVVGGGARHFHLRLRMLVIMVVVIVLSIGMVVGALVYRHNKQTQKKAISTQQKLEKNTTYGNGLGDMDQLKKDSNDLIQGSKSGSYDVSNKQLAQAYASRGDTELNAGDYKSAVADYQKAVELDSSMLQTVGYGEFLARYHLGERKELVSLLQQLEKPLKNNHDPQIQQQVTLYDAYIADLQAGKELEL